MAEDEQPNSEPQKTQASGAERADPPAGDDWQNAAKDPWQKYQTRPPPHGGGGDDDDDAGERRSQGSESVTSQIAELVRLAVAELEKDKKKSFRPKGSLGTAKLEEFYGEKDKYKRWKKVTKAQQFIYQLADEEMSLLLYLACRKDARDTIDVMEVSEMTEREALPSFGNCSTTRSTRRKTKSWTKQRSRITPGAERPA
jgi:hypothetical protein